MTILEKLIPSHVELSSMCGAQQGDPLGALLFSLAIKQVAETMKQQEGVDLSVWYLDDGTIGGSPDGVSQAFQNLIRISEDMGLSVKLPKCELMPLAECQTDEFLAAVGFDVPGLKVIHGGYLSGYDDEVDKVLATGWVAPEIHHNAIFRRCIFYSAETHFPLKNFQI